MRKIYICSPLSGKDPAVVRQNMMHARGRMQMFQALNHDVRAYAPHAYLPEMLDDNNPYERKLALDFGMRLLDMCDTIYIFGDKVSEGMKKEIAYAQMYRKQFIFETKEIERKVKEFLGE